MTAALARPLISGDSRMSAAVQLAVGALTCRDTDGVDVLLHAWPMGLEGSLVAAARRAWADGERPLTAPGIVARMGANSGPWTREVLEDARAAFAASPFAESGLSELANALAAAADATALASELAAAANTLDAGGDPAEVRRALLPLVEVGEAPSEHAWADTDRQCDAAISSLDRQDGGGLSFGLPALELCLGVVLGGELVTLGGRPGTGKSTLALNIADRVSRAGAGVLVFSQEVPAPEWRLKLSACRLEYRFAAVRKGRWSELPNDARTQVQADLERQRRDGRLIVYGEPSVTPARLLSVAKRKVRTEGVRLIVVDHLQRLRLPGRDRRIEVGGAATMLKNLALETGTVVLLLSQLARPAGDEFDAVTRPPSMYSLKESGDVEAESDRVLLVHRRIAAKVTADDLAAAKAGRTDVWDLFDPGMMAVRIAKQRDGGPTDTDALLRIDGNVGRIYDAWGVA
jgi:replicative DNA helicase